MFIINKDLIFIEKVNIVLFFLFSLTVAYFRAKYFKLIIYKVVGETVIDECLFNVCKFFKE